MRYGPVLVKEKKQEFNTCKGCFYLNTRNADEGRKHVTLYSCSHKDSKKHEVWKLPERKQDDPKTLTHPKTPKWCPML